MKHDRLTGRPRKDEYPNHVPPAKRPRGRPPKSDAIYEESSSDERYNYTA